LHDLSVDRRSSTVVTLLSRAIARDTLPPAMLFAGPAGIGKRRVALALASSINCLEPVSTPTLQRDACSQCASCRRIARAVHPDVIVIEPGDSGTIKIDDVRDVIKRAGYRPFEARRRVVIIDEADALVQAAQNALLKTLEEPPSASVFILVSSMPGCIAADGALAEHRACGLERYRRPTSPTFWCGNTATRRPMRGRRRPTRKGASRVPLSMESADVVEARDTAQRLSAAGGPRHGSSATARPGEGADRKEDLACRRARTVVGVSSRDGLTAAGHRRARAAR
jgi:hypothetical protein